MPGYNVIYKGPSVAESPEKAERIAGAIAARLPTSIKEANQRLEKTPFALISHLNRKEAERYYYFLKAMGASVEIKEDELEVASFDARDHFKPKEVESSFLRSGVIKSLIYNLGPGLLIIVVIFLAGIAQIVGSRFWRSQGMPFWQLSAAGWITVGIATLILGGMLILRLPLISRALKKPDQSTPLKTLESYFAAINSRHWTKAVSCLAISKNGIELGNSPFEETREYFRKLASELVLPELLDASSLTFINAGSDFAEVRIKYTAIARKPLSDGTRLRRSYIDVFRFIARNDTWYLVDGRLFGQKSPDRLPMPGCRTCTEEVIVGQVTCERCNSAVPPYALDSEQWIVPRRKSNLAALYSAVIPGLGQTYNSQPLKGAIIAATSWMVLPWAAGVIDAITVSERINRQSSMHDLHQRPWIAMIIHTVLFAAAVFFVLFNAHELPLLKDIIQVAKPAQEEINQSSVIARFRGDDGNYSILFPYRWEVEETPVTEGERVGEAVVNASDPETDTSIAISTRPVPANWIPCTLAIETRRLMEEKGETIANVECGSKGGREQYRIDSYTADRQWRRTLLVLGYENELVVLAFACPTNKQDTMVDIFEMVADSLRYAQNSNTTIRR